MPTFNRSTPSPARRIILTALAFLVVCSTVRSADPEGVIPASEFIDVLTSEPTLTRDVRGIEVVSEPQVTTRIEFQYDSTELANDAARRQLAEAGAAFNHESLRSRRFIVEGHTDSRGSEQYNLKLSQQRAEAIVKILVDAYQVAPDRLTAVGKGEFEMIDNGDTEAAHQRNRRVVFVRAD